MDVKELSDKHNSIGNKIHSRRVIITLVGNNGK